MSDFSQGPGWWQASDLRWYPPEAVPGPEAADPAAADPTVADLGGDPLAPQVPAWTDPTSGPSPDPTAVGPAPGAPPAWGPPPLPAPAPAWAASPPGYGPAGHQPPGYGAPAAPPYGAGPGAAPGWGTPAYGGGYPAYGPAYGATASGLPSVKGLATASLVLGIVSLVLFLCWFLAAPVALVGFGVGMAALSKINKGNADPDGRGVALAGVICSGIAIALAVLLFVLIIAT